MTYPFQPMLHPRSCRMLIESNNRGVVSSQMRRWIPSLFLFTAMLSAAPADLDRANQLYERTQYSEALKLLVPLPPTAPILEAIGKNYFMTGDFKKAQDAFEKAIAMDPNGSSYYHWLGRTYGRRAETSSFVT